MKHKNETGGATLEQRPYLQQILGTDKRNPVFTVFRDAKGEQLHVYYGAQLLEIVRADKEDPEFKLLVARLYNAGIKAKSLEKEFGIARKTMKRWGDALKSGDADQLLQALRGRGGHRKLTPEIESYVRMRFGSIYGETRYAYSQRVRQELKKVFGVSISAETLRPLLKELKQQAAEPLEPNWGNSDAPKRENPGDSELAHGEPPAAQALECEPVLCQEADTLGPDNRQESPVFAQPTDGAARLCHHAGVLIFNAVLVRVEQSVGQGGWLLKQWLATILLGAVNIEQTKLLDLCDLTFLLGKTLSSLRPQRLQLTQLASPENVHQLLRLNADGVDLDAWNDFYYDPHSKHYTGMQKVLKGWCAVVRGVGKALYMDFIHTAGGHPVYIEHLDNYEDLRARFYKITEEFRTLVGIDHWRVLSLVLDRGIYSLDVFHQIIESENYHLITWQKGYQAVPWREQQITGRFLLQRPRNNCTDLRTYRFEYIDRAWPRDERMRQLRVQATNPRGQAVQVGILTDDRHRQAPEIITLIFNRWIQENDFKYLEHHFGINQITSYASTAYKRLQDNVEQRQMKSGQYKALEQERQAVRTQLKKLLLQEHQRPGKNVNRQKRIAELDRRHDEIQHRMAQTEKEVSRLEYLIEQEHVRLDTRNKKLMDVLKLIGRNAFYEALEPFKKLYDNYRDDHVLFRNLTQAHGVLIERAAEVEVVLYPTPNYSRKLRRIVSRFLEQLNATTPLLPDGSGRCIRFRLADKTGIQLAIVQA
ncbi:hypothetical protein MYX65_10770 [Acidobacteria bacterium AH-259-L09]|nr:hypothetical protein [Acidobacteria bacterium AH-259-L09]